MLNSEKYGDKVFYQEIWIRAVRSQVRGRLTRHLDSNTIKKGLLKAMGRSSTDMSLQKV